MDSNNEKQERQDGVEAALVDMGEGWVNPCMGTAKQITAAARSQAGGEDAFWAGYEETLVAHGY